MIDGSINDMAGLHNVKAQSYEEELAQMPGILHSASMLL